MLKKGYLNRLSIEELQALYAEKIQYLQDMREKARALETEINLVREVFCKKNAAFYTKDYPVNAWYEIPSDEFTYATLLYVTKRRIICSPHGDEDNMEYTGLQVTICDNAEDVLYYADDINIRELSCGQVFYVCDTQDRTGCLPHPLPRLTALVKYGISLEDILALPLTKGEEGDRFIIVNGKFCKVKSCTSNLE